MDNDLEHIPFGKIKKEHIISQKWQKTVSTPEYMTFRVVPKCFLYYVICSKGNLHELILTTKYSTQGRNNSINNWWLI